MTFSFYIFTSERDNLTRVFVDFGSMPQENVTFQPLFDQALAAQQQKNWDESLRLYDEILDKGQVSLTSDQAATVYHNKAAIYFAQNNHVMAYTHAKKAVKLDPSNKIFSQLFGETAKKFDPPKIPSQISLEQKIEKSVNWLPFDGWALLTLILFAFSCRSVFQFIFTYRKNNVENLNLKNPSWKPLVFLFIFFIGLAGTIKSQQIADKIEGLIKTDKTPVQTAAGENKTVIFEAPQGLSVEVLKKESSPNGQTYLQVKYPGAFSGWVDLKNIEVLRWPNE